MATRRRVRHHRKRYRGGEAFVERPFVMPPGANSRLIRILKAKHLAAERARYEAWKKSRDVEAREDAKGREEDAKMAAFNEKQKQQRAKELEDLRKLEEERRKGVESSEPPNPCVAVLKEAGVVGKTAKDLKGSVRRFAVKNHPDKNIGSTPEEVERITENFKKVYGCYQKKLAYLERREASGAGRKTRRRKSHRRR